MQIHAAVTAFSARRNPPRRAPRIFCLRARTRAQSEISIRRPRRRQPFFVCPPRAGFKTDEMYAAAAESSRRLLPPGSAFQAGRCARCAERHAESHVSRMRISARARAREREGERERERGIGRERTSVSAVGTRDLAWERCSRCAI